MDLPAEPRVAWDSDGEAWEEIIAENGEPTGVFKARVPDGDGDGDELTLGQLDQQYGLDSVDAGDRDLLLWLHAEAVWEARVESDNADDWCAKWESAEASRRDWAAEADRLQHAYDETVTALSEEIAWQRDAYRDGHPNARTEALASGRTIGMEDARRTLTETFARSLPLCAVHPEADR